MMLHFQSFRPSHAKRNLVLGTAKFGSQVSQDEAFAQMDQFAEAGGDMLDTAHIYGAWAPEGVNAAEQGYGNSEVVIGRWLKSRGMQDAMTIAGKGAHPTFKGGISCMNELAIHQHLQESLNRLQVDCIPLYFFHRDDPKIPVVEMLSWLAPAVADGRIGMIACSHWRPARMQEALVASDRLEIPLLRANQVSWSFVHPRNVETTNIYGEQLTMSAEMWQFHLQHQIPVFAYNAQAAGFFATRHDGVDFHSPNFPKPNLVYNYAHQPINLNRRKRAQELAEKFGVSTNQIALAWLMHQPFPVYPLIAPSTPEQMSDSLAAEKVKLREQDVTWLAGEELH